MTYCSYDTLAWCLKNSLCDCNCIETLISECVRLGLYSKLCLLINSGGVVTQRHINAAVMRFRVTFLKVLCRGSKRWNPSNSMEALRYMSQWCTLRCYTDWNEFVMYLGDMMIQYQKSYTTFMYNKVLKFMFDWCKVRHIPVRRWNSQSTLHHIMYKGDVDQEGMVQSSTSKLRVVCKGMNFRHPQMQCIYAPVGTLSDGTNGSPLHRWMCNPTKLLVSHQIT